MDLSAVGLRPDKTTSLQSFYPQRMSVTPAASQMRVPAGNPIIVIARE
ncbi:hypothetical protein [Burkholderia ubonensis]